MQEHTASCHSLIQYLQLHRGHVNLLSTNTKKRCGSTANIAWITTIDCICDLAKIQSMLDPQRYKKNSFLATVLMSCIGLGIHSVGTLYTFTEKICIFVSGYSIAAWDSLKPSPKNKSFFFTTVLLWCVGLTINSIILDNPHRKKLYFSGCITNMVSDYSIQIEHMGYT